MSKTSEREWVEKYKLAVQNEKLINILDFYPIPQVGAWTFLKLAFLWNFAHTYTNIIGGRYANMCYVDLFSGSGLGFFKNYGGNTQFLLGSPTLMATIDCKHPFKKCFFFESVEENINVLRKRLEILKHNEKMTCEDYVIIPEDSNIRIDEVIDNLRKTSNAHFLLFVDPYSTEIHWSTMEKLLSLKYPSFDMIFNFQPFGVNRKSYRPETLIQYFGDEEYKKYLKVPKEKRLDMLESYYIQKLKRYRMVKTVRVIRITSGKGGFYYDLIYTTRKEKPPWLPAIEHVKTMIGGFTGYEVSIIFDPLFLSLDKF